MTKEQAELEDGNFDLTDGIGDSLKESVEEFFFQNEIENFNVPEGGELLKTMPKLIADITDKKFNRLEKFKKFLEVALKVALEAWKKRN